MPEPPLFTVQRAVWPRDEAAIARVRRAVFIEEQAVPEELEWEDIDPQCAWFVARAGDRVVGIARLTPEGRIGRMAVMPAWRQRGVGRALLQAALSQAREHGLTGVHLSAQTHASGFYARQGFIAVGEVYQDAGIPHIHMVWMSDTPPGRSGKAPI